MNTKEIELTLEEAKNAVRRRDELPRLADTKIWKELITEGYFKDESVRLVLLLSDPAVTPDVKRQIHLDMEAIGRFRSYLNRILMFGNQVERDIPDYEEALLEARAEEEGFPVELQEPTGAYDSVAGE